MTKRMVTSMLLLPLISGCATQGSVEAAREARLAYQSFIAQPRTYTAIRLHGETMTVTLTGVTEFVMESPLPPLSAMPTEHDAPGRIADAAKNTLLGLAGIAALHDIGTQGATVVQQPAPLVVRPEVISP